MIGVLLYGNGTIKIIQVVCCIDIHVIIFMFDVNFDASSMDDLHVSYLYL
jgi:hypothetical protein